MLASERKECITQTFTGLERISLTLGKPVHFYWECQLCMFLHPTNFVRYCDFMLDNPQEGKFLNQFVENKLYERIAWIF
ncbi:hypothetical protein Y032_0831g2585 [Ancylostoma ceylanicum]|uniref:Uncharacterized protein n=1 Tax=Ancylostoma ceylanicum TaxID=53326 RepID=A0A016WBT2_9BILA|nr:hypothetical protein Y032_0831g2585 [Ancylostoma ceylanicum]